MTKSERIQFKRGDETAVFEIGYRTLEKECNFVYNPRTRQLEQIWGYESGNQEGTNFQRVETFPHIWYDVDGTTIFAKRVSDRS